MPPRTPPAPTRQTPTPQTPDQLAQLIATFLSANPETTAIEDGKVLFDLRTARHSLATAHSRCTLQLWDDTRNIVRHVIAAEPRGPATLRLRTQRLGAPRPQTLDLTAPAQARRSPSTRESIRIRYLAILERALERNLPDWRPDAFRTAMDLEKSFGPAYARGLLLGTGLHANTARAVIAVNETEPAATIDGILTFGILWLANCRETHTKRHVAGLTLILPRGTAATTLSRLAWLAGPPTQWQLFELDPATQQLTPRDPADQGNLHTALLHAPNLEAARQRFAAASAQVMALVPEASRALITQRVRSATELAFLLHGLEFARVRQRASSENFNRIEQITFGDAASETALTPSTQPKLRTLVEALCQRRHPAANKRDPLYRAQPERWLEDRLHVNLPALDPALSPDFIYSQVPAIAGTHGLTHAPDRGLLDLLSITLPDHRLAVIELKASEDPQLALQGLDYWLRVRFHHRQHPDPATGLTEFQRHGYFPTLRLSPEDPRLYLVAPALQIHPATEIVLRHLSPRVPWTLIALDERWRTTLKVVFRKHAPGI